MRPAFRRALNALAPALALGTAGLTVACADTPTSPAAAPGGAAYGKLAGASVTTSWLDGSSTTNLKSTETGVQSQHAAGDTVVTLIQVGTDPSHAIAMSIGNSSKIEFPYAAGSICDPATANYGTASWDAPCAASAKPVRIVAKSWINAEGKAATDFQPALRFVPGLDKPSVVVLRDAALAGTRVDYCTPTACVDEAEADPSLAAVLDPTNGKVYRPIKHFSGYTVIANRSSSMY